MAEEKQLTAAQKAIEKAAKKAKKAAKRAAEAAQAQVEATNGSMDEVAQAVADEDNADEAARKKEEKRLRKEEKKKRKRDTAEADEAAPSKKSKKAAPQESTTSTPASLSADLTSFLADNEISYDPSSGASEYPPALSFGELQIEDGLRQGLSAFAKPTPIQSASFPIMMGGRDVIGIAETGSGKTVAFGVPAVQHILSLPEQSKKAPVSVLVIAPTRELAMQTESNLAALAKALPSIKSTCIYGGVSKDDQKRILKKDRPRIVVGTPGRLLDLAQEGAIDLSHVSWLVLDEADRMLDKGFENDIREIIKQCRSLPTSRLPAVGRQGTAATAPTSRQTAMFSATWPQSVRRLASDFMFDPIRITVGADELTANARVSQTAIVLDDPRTKERKLLDVLREHGFNKGATSSGKDCDKALIFALYKKEATRVTEWLQRNNYRVGCIQGDMSQDKRTKSLDDFKNGRVQLLVATDVAARGLDIPKVELVVNQTFPLTIEDYIHRIGRTGRAGRKGKSVTFFTEHDKAHAGEFMRVLRDGGHEVPEELGQWGTTIKKPTHSAYGAHFRTDIQGQAKKIVFD